MSKKEIKQLKKDLDYLKKLHKIYIDNWDKFKSMSDEEKNNRVLDIMTEINKIQKILDNYNTGE